MLTLVVTLVILAFVLLILELFMPGAVLGTCALILLLAAVILAYLYCGALVGTLLLAGSVAICGVGFCIWAVTFDKTPAGKRMTLTSAITTEKEDSPNLQYLGKQGVAMTMLVPSGSAMIGNKKVDVLAESALIEKGSKIYVTSVDGMKIVVRQIDETSYQGSNPS